MSHPKSGFYERDEKEYVSVSSVLGRTAELFNPNKKKGLEIWRQMEPNWEELVAGERLFIPRLNFRFLEVNKNTGWRRQPWTKS